MTDARLSARSFDAQYIALSTNRFRDGDSAGTMRQIDCIISSFLDEMNYEIMGDFFLTFRSYIDAPALLEKLLAKYDECAMLTGAAALGKRVRIFVAFRHWVLNYFADDFTLAPDLCTTFADFIYRLGGRGADEITTDARIAKELNKIWERECQTNGLPNPAGPFTPKPDVCELPADGDFLRTRAATPAALATPALQNKSPNRLTRKRNIHRALVDLRKTVTKQTEDTACTADLLFVASTPDMRKVFSPQQGIFSPQVQDACFSPRPRSTDSGRDKQNEALSSCPSSISSYCPTEAAHEVQAVPASILLSSPPPKSLKRMPGGDLKAATLVSDLDVRASVGTFLSRASFRPYLAIWEAAGSSSPCVNNRPVYKADEMEEFVKTMTDLQDDDENDEAPDAAVDTTLNKLEGRTKRQHSDVETGEDTVEGLNITKAVKQKRRGTRYIRFESPLPSDDDSVKPEIPLNDADSFVLPFEDRMAAESKISDFVQQLTAGDDAPTTECIVEALAVPSCNVTSFGSIWLSPMIHRPFVLDHNPAHVAQQLTSLETKVFLELDWLELCSSSWLSSTAEVLDERSWESAINKQVSGLSTIVARFNLSIQWIISEIVLSAVLSTRVQTITQFIDIAQLCRTYNNFTTVVQIVLALQNPIVRRLKRTWRYISSPALKTLRDLETLTMPHNSWSLLRIVQEKQLLSVDSKMVPFLGPYLSELLSLETQRPELAVAPRSMRTAGIVKTLLRMLDRCDLDRFDRDEELLQKCVWIRALDEEEMEVCLSKCS